MKYKMIQVKEETHSLLQQYCKENGYTMSGLIHKLISERSIPKNVLRVHGVLQGTPNITKNRPY